MNNLSMKILSITTLAYALILGGCEDQPRRAITPLEALRDDCQPELALAQESLAYLNTSLSKLEDSLKRNPCPTDSKRDTSILTDCSTELYKAADWQRQLNKQVDSWKYKLDECRFQLGEGREEEKSCSFRVEDLQQRLTKRLDTLEFLNKLNQQHCLEQPEESLDDLLTQCEVRLQKENESGIIQKLNEQIENTKQQIDECQDQQGATGHSFFYDSNKGSGFSIEMERYKNQKDGYTIEVPRSWGAIQPYGNTFTDNLYEGMETIGPFLGFRENQREYLYIEVLSKEDAGAENVLAEYESWFDFYKSLRLKDSHEYTAYDLFDESSTKEKSHLAKELVMSDENGDYTRTRRVMESDKGLYIFSYDRDNSIHVNIVNSIELD